MDYCKECGDTLIKKAQENPPTTTEPVMCRRDHVLKLRYKRVPRCLKSGYVSMTERYYCNDCCHTIDLSDGYYKCDDMNCDYDLCDDCYKDEYNSLRIDTKLRCADNHPMYYLTKAEKRRINQVEIVDGVNLKCQACRKAFTFDQGFFKCDKGTCDYDFCKSCGSNPMLTKVKCENNHIMVPQLSRNQSECGKCKIQVSVGEKLFGCPEAVCVGFSMCINCSLELGN